MNKRIVAVIGMLLMGYLIKVFIESLPDITIYACKLVMAYPVAMKFIIGGFVAISAFMILYELTKLLLKWQDPDSHQSRSVKKG